MKFELLEPYIPMFMSGLVVTCQVTAAALAIALVLGFLIAVLKVLPCRPLRAVLNFYTSIFRGVPLIVLLFLAYFATPQLTGFKIFDVCRRCHYTGAQRLSDGVRDGARWYRGR